MSDYPATTNDSNIANLDKAIESKRQEVNALRVEFKVMEAQIDKKRKEIALLQTLTESSTNLLNNKNVGDIGITEDDVKAIHQQIHTIAVSLSEEELKFVRITQELDNAEKDLEFLNQKMINHKTPSPATNQTDSEKTMQEKNNPWLNGSFYLFATIMTLTTLAFISSLIPFYSVVLVFVVGLLFVLIIGALQLRSNNNLSEASFVKLMVEALKILPSILKIKTPVNKE